MDPASIIGLVDASLDLAIKCGSTVKHLNTIASQYKHARLTILSMVQNLDSLHLAWNRISIWSKSYVPDQGAVESCLVERLERFLETGALVMEALDEDLSTYNPDDLSFTQRSRLIWNEQVLQEHQNRLRDQATSMTLLLQAIQLPTIQETNGMLQNAREQFQRSDESAYSIGPSRMSSRPSTSTRESLSSDNDMSYRRLSFENDLFIARVYKRSYRTPLIQRFFRRKVKIESDTATITGPEKTLRSKSPDTEEHSLDGDKPLDYEVGDFSALQPRPKISLKYEEVIPQNPRHRERAHAREEQPKRSEDRRLKEAVDDLVSMLKLLRAILRYQWCRSVRLDVDLCTILDSPAGPFP